MCYYSDLFGDIIVTIEDVNLWLDAIPELQGATNQRRNYYAQFHDVANKIKLSKLNHSYEKIIFDIENAALYAETPLDIFKTVYKSDLLELQSIKCPDYFHVCENPNCEVYAKRRRHEKHAADYAKRKKYKRPH